jgi:hypothetical protein
MHSHQGKYILYYINHQSINPLTSINHLTSINQTIGINDNMIQQDKYLKKRPILGEREHRHSSSGSDGHKGRMSYIYSTLHQSDIPYSKGEILFRGRSKAFRQGE